MLGPQRAGIDVLVVDVRLARRVARVLRRKCRIVRWHEHKLIDDTCLVRLVRAILRPRVDHWYSGNHISAPRICVLKLAILSHSRIDSR